MVHADGGGFTLRILSPHREKIAIRQNLHQDGSVRPTILTAKSLHQCLARGRYQFPNCLRVVAMRDAVRSYELPQSHQSADGWVHRKRVTEDHRHDLAGDVDLGPATEIGAENVADELRRKIWLNLPPWLDVHRPEIGLAETGFAVKVVEGRGVFKCKGGTNFFAHDKKK